MLSAIDLNYRLSNQSQSPAGGQRIPADKKVALRKYGAFQERKLSPDAASATSDINKGSKTGDSELIGDFAGTMIGVEERYSPGYSPDSIVVPKPNPVKVHISHRGENWSLVLEAQNGVIFGGTEPSPDGRKPFGKITTGGGVLRWEQIPTTDQQGRKLEANSSFCRNVLTVKVSGDRLAGEKIQNCFHLGQPYRVIRSKLEAKRVKLQAQIASKLLDLTTGER